MEHTVDKILKSRVWGIQHKILELSNPGTFQAQAVSLTFKDQNINNKIYRNTKEVKVDPVLFPVQSDTALVQHTLSLPG